MEMVTKTPKSVAANGWRNPFSSRKKFIIRCGECGYGYADKPILQERMTSVCPACHSMNVWSFKAWKHYYDLIRSHHVSD